MSFFIPEALSAFASAGAALQALYQWRRRAVGNARVLIMEIEENYTFLDMVVFDEVPLNNVIQDLSVSEYKRLAGEGFDFNRLKRNRLQDDLSFEGTQMSHWAGKSTAELIDSIYEKLTDLMIRYPHNFNNPKYRWNVRVQNIIKLTWLLLKHVGSDCSN